MTEKYQSDYPNSHYLANLNSLNKPNQLVNLNRLPTLGEILSNKTKSPVDLYTFYLFMKEIENKVDYLDFWFDLINHLNLCKFYVKGLRDSILRHSTQSNEKRNSDTNQQPLFSHNTTNLESNLRNSVPLLEKSKHKSLSSSILLDLIINDHVLEDNDSNRLSQFLRGDININNLDPKLKSILDQYQDTSNHSTPISNTYKFDEPNQPYNQPKRISSNSKLLDDEANSSQSSLLDNQLDVGEANKASFISSPKYVSLNSPNLSNDEPLEPPKKVGQQQQQQRNSINPSLLEKLIKENTTTSSENHSFITRNNLKESSHNLLLKYFVEDSEKNLNLPQNLNDFIIKSIEVDGRDDPDIFNQVKSFVFNKIENDHLPKFLNFMAIRNINKSINIRIILGFISLFIGFWIAYSLIFLNYYKGYRAVIVIPFLISFYCLISSIYLIDPILCWFKLSESFVYNNLFIKIREPFIYKLLLKRSCWVLFLILLLTLAFTLIFSLVPGHRL
ncbi:hypothetical protein HYPBUDRAFT_12742 [Hyphopichia burtonii NRRL Y-1933]|uniref:RGS domain-containing protein n=1 Tax=Hyphopichia burtonii NRRL Y-1933 TaxID=984485 RepID=A0A1E4RGB9_9ASCO|nr:hypothetical protein HYPBUDRAFT_12742 [Hyphopichia burtonii NRRL Y-1933]ODV66175.1 hypothetical protein HYPBUDRAFT_12742 [Hyphopichia burtonii NRRL Y-1933]